MADEDTPAPAAGEATPDPDEATWQEATAAERDDKKPPEEPAATEAADEAAPDADKAPEPAAEETPQDIWATAPEPLRNDYLALKAKYDKDHRQIAGQRRKIAELMRPPAAPPPAKADIDDAFTGLADYPEIEGAVRKITTPLYENIANAQAAREAARMEDLVEQANLVEDDHPGWVDFLTENRGKFDAFVADEDQPAWVAKAYAANMTDVTDAASAARLISRFKDSLGTPPAADPPNTRTSDRRAAQLSGLSTPPPRGGAVTSSLPASADPEAIWKEAARKERQNQA